MIRVINSVAALSLLVAACSDPIAPLLRNPTGGDTQTAANQSVALPIELTFKAENPCSNVIVIYKIAGTAFTNRQASRREVLGQGTVKSNDGFTGYFGGRAVFAENTQVIEMGEFETTHEDGRKLFMMLSLRYTDSSGQPTIGVEEVKPVRCGLSVPPRVEF